MTLRILVSDPLSDAGLHRLNEAADVEVTAPGSMDREAFLAGIAGHDGLIVRSGTKVDAKALESADRLRVIGRAGSGLDNIDVEAATAKGVVVMNTPGVNATATAEHTWALLLAVCRKVPAADASVRQGEWERQRFPGTQLSGKTLGVVGLGRVGRLVAERGRAFGMRVVGYDPYLATEMAADLRVELAGLDQLFAEADVVTLHTPLTEETEAMVNAERLARMKPGGWLVNCARGGLVDERAVAEALSVGRLAGAAFDVFEAEPPAESPLLDLPNVVLTPHLGASTIEAQRDVSVQVVDQVLDALQREEYRNAVNLPFVTGDLSELRPWLDLAERLGRLGISLTPGQLKSVELVTRGPEVEPHARSLIVALLKGVLTPALGDGVNYVNAAHLAAERGIAVGRTARASVAEYANLVGCRIRTDGGESNVGGTLFHSHPRAVEIDGYHLDAPPEGHVLLVWNRDVPGVIGRVGTLLGDASVNIAEWRLGRVAPGETALAFINVDNLVPAETIQALEAIEGVTEVRQLHFPD